MLELRNSYVDVLHYCITYCDQSVDYVFDPSHLQKGGKTNRKTERSALFESGVKAVCTPRRDCLPSER